MGKKGFVLPLLVLSVALSSCLISLPAARAQLSGTSLPSGQDVMKAIVIFLFGNDYNASWLTYEGFMQNLIFPFIAIFVVMYGILSELRLFHNAGVKSILSLVMAFVGGSWALTIMHGFLMANAIWGTVLWGLLLFFGIAVWAVSRGMEYYGWGFNAYQNVKNSGKLMKDMEKLEKQVEMDHANAVLATGKDKERAIEMWEKNAERLKQMKERLEPGSH